jgi:hypothetical protein
VVQGAVARATEASDVKTRKVNVSWRYNSTLDASWLR